MTAIALMLVLFVIICGIVGFLMALGFMDAHDRHEYFKKQALDSGRGSGCTACDLVMVRRLYKLQRKGR